MTQVPILPIDLLRSFWRSVILFELQLSHLKNGFTYTLPCKDSEVVKITQDLREFLNSRS